MPKGDNQQGKKRGPYKGQPEDVEIRLHPRPKVKPPRMDVRKTLIPGDDSDLDSNKYQKKHKKEDETEEEQESQKKVSRVMARFLNKKT